jgi:ubiquinone biosynthesis protein
MRDRPNKEISPAERLKEIIAVFGRYNLIHGITPEKLRHILENLGPTFVKLGQILSMRPDMIPEEYCRELTLLRTEVSPMDFQEVIHILDSEYGEDYLNIFASIDPSPLGSASIAQVHAAVLKDGRKMALKIQRPGIYERMDQDIKLLHKASVIIKIISRTGRVIDVNMVLDELWNAAKKEMDFVSEAQHIKRFTELNSNVAFLAFPEVEWKLTTPRVLCMEYIGGIQIDDTEKLVSEGYDLRDIALKLVAGYVRQVLDDGFFHADPHPGNIRIRDNKIIWLDMGMVGTLSARDRQLFTKALTAIAGGDVFELKAAILAISRHSGRINHTRLTEDIEEMLSRYGNMELRNFNIGQTMTEVLEIAELNGLAMPAGVSMLSRGMITMEGVITKLDPESSVVEIFSKVLSGSVFKNIDIFKEIERGGRTLYSIYNRSGEISSNMMELLKLAVKGQGKLNVEFIGSEEPLGKINKMVNRLIVCILCAATLIGSSLICMTDMQPKILGIPLLGVLGYFAAFVMSVWLLIGIIRRI